MLSLNVNGRDHQIDVEPDMPILWVLREQLGLTGTKFGCGIAQCGACTVHLDGQPVRSCSYPASATEGRKVVTIEGLSPTSSHPVQLAWKALDVPQCGYCQSGQIMSAVALLAEKPTPTDEDIDAAMAGNVCRCGTYQRVRAAIKEAAVIAKALPDTTSAAPCSRISEVTAASVRPLAQMSSTTSTWRPCTGGESRAISTSAAATPLAL
jgi:isoquinoline 1-oxidoreductase alpha subunit